MYPKATLELAQSGASRSQTQRAFQAFSQAVFADGALSSRTKQLIAVAVAHVDAVPLLHPGPHEGTCCRPGATAQELMEAVWVAAEMKAGAAFTHSTLMLDVVETSTN